LLDQHCWCSSLFGNSPHPCGDKLTELTELVLKRTEKEKEDDKEKWLHTLASLPGRVLVLEQSNLVQECLGLSKVLEGKCISPFAWPQPKKPSLALAPSPSPATSPVPLSAVPAELVPAVVPLLVVPTAPSSAAPYLPH
jgi:hypothetical protein